MCCSVAAVYECVCVCLCMYVYVCTSIQCGDGGSVSSVRTAVNTAGVQLPSRGWAGPR